MHHLRVDFHVSGECGSVREFVHACDIYHQNKGEQL
jgi:hypothetical protein